MEPMVQDYLPVGELGERKLIKRLRDAFPQLSLTGDDSAILPSLACPVVTTDSFLEGRHFYRWWCDPALLGRRLLEATLSDLAAMGAEPGWVFPALGLPRDLDVFWIEGFYGGLTSRDDCFVAGGEIVRSDVLSVTLTAVGEGNDPALLMKRSGLEQGHALWVTGRIGRALDAPMLIEKAGGFIGPDLIPASQKLDAPLLEQVRSFLKPRAAFREARYLVGRGVRAGIDISDGLVSEAAHLAAESGVDTHIDMDCVPFFESVAQRPLEASSAGEDFVLLFGAPAGEDFSGDGFSRVGDVRTGDGQIHVHSAGSEIASGSGGFDHFA
jgi:thiamine-monophosphate kinase